MKLKFKNILLISMLAVAGIFSATAVAFSKQVNEQPVAEKAEAVETKPFYFFTNWNWQSFKVYYWGSSGSNPSWDSSPDLTNTGTSITRGGITGTLWKYDTMPVDIDGLIVRGQDKDSGNAWKQSVNYTTWDPDGNNAVYFSSWNTGQGKANLAGAAYKTGNPVADTNQFYLYDPNNYVSGTKYIYGFGEADTIKAMTWPGTTDGISSYTLGRTPMYNVTLSQSYPTFVINNNSSRSKDISISGNTGKVLVIDEPDTGDDWKHKYHWDNADIYTDCPATDGYYLLGDSNFVTATGGTGTAWKFETGVKMTTLPGLGEDNKANYVLTVDRTVLFRARSYFDLIGTWLSFGTTYDGTDGITTSGDNVQLAAGTYTVYVNSKSAVYVAKGIPLDAFCPAFLDAIADVCKMDGSTNFNDLSNTWTSLSTLYSSVTAGGKSEISAIGFNGGSDADDPHKVVLAYHYIVTKYGSAKCADFIWGQNVPGRSAIRDFSPFNIMGGEDSFSTIIIVIASSVALLSVTALSILVIRKRKSKEQ